MHIIQSPLFDFEAFIRIESNDRLVIVLEALDAEKLLATLEREHWTGRKGYPVRGMWSALIAGVLNQCHSLAEVIRMLEHDKDTRMVCGFSKDDIPSEDALGRFLKKLVRHEDLLQECFEGLVEKLRQLLPGFGRKLVVDSTDIEAFSDGHSKTPSDADARWGAKKKGQGGGKETGGTASGKPGKGVETGTKKGKAQDIYYWFGYKLHLVVDAIYELPIAFTLTPANESDTTQMAPLLEKSGAKKAENNTEFVIGDKGYDSKENNRLVFMECGAIPIIPIRERKDAQMADICNAKGTPSCICGLEMIFWGRDGNYLKYRCPQAVGKNECASRFPCTASSYGNVLKLPILKDIRLHPPVPRESKKWKRLYKLRTAVERVNSRIKGLLGLEHITVRGIAKVMARSLLSLLVMVAIGVGMAQRHRLKEVRTLVG